MHCKHAFFVTVFYLVIFCCLGFQTDDELLVAVGLVEGDDGTVTLWISGKYFLHFIGFACARRAIEDGLDSFFFFNEINT